MKILINNNDKTKLSSLPIDEFWHTISKLKDYSDTYINVKWLDINNNTLVVSEVSLCLKAAIKNVYFA